MALAPLNPTNITPPRVEFIDPRSGAISREWYRFFLSLRNATQDNQEETTLGPDTASLLATYDAMLMSATQASEVASDGMVASLESSLNSLQNAFGVTPPNVSGTVTSVAASGGTTGLTFTGSPITTSGTLTLSGTLAVANGGTGATTLTGYVKGSGTSAFTASATVPAADVSGLATVATSGSFADLSNKPGIRSNGQNVINSSTTLGSADNGTNILILTSGITITFPASGFSSGHGFAISNVSGGNVTLSAPGGSDFGTTLPNNGTFFAFCDGGGFWRQYCYSTSRL